MDEFSNPFPRLSAQTESCVAVSETESLRGAVGANQGNTVYTIHLIYRALRSEPDISAKGSIADQRLISTI